MKKKTSILFSLLMLLLVFVMPANAATSGDYDYVVKNGKACITKYNGNASMVTIPASLDGYQVTSIEPDPEEYEGVFGYSLTSVTIPNGVTSIGNDAFAYCSELTSISIPNGVTSIGNSAFHGCSELTSVTIPDSVKKIGTGAFWSCSKLTNVSLSNGITEIADSLFYDCSSLTKITIPSGVKSIGEGAFCFCEKLESIVIPKAVTSIEEGAFNGCDGITIYFSGNAPKIDQGVFWANWDIPYISATVYIESTDSSWKKLIKKNYHSDITWVLNLKNKNGKSSVSVLPHNSNPISQDTSGMIGLLSTALDTKLTHLKTDEIKGSIYQMLQVKVKKIDSTALTIQWNKVAGATGYVVYGAECGGTYKKLKTLSTNNFTQKKLKKGTYYKYFVVAMTGKIAMATSKTVYLATSGGKVGNVKSVTLNKKSITLRPGKAIAVKASVKLFSSKLAVKKFRAVSFESTDPTVATVSASGKIKAVADDYGECNIYAYAQDGASAKVKVKVER